MNEDRRRSHIRAISNAISGGDLATVILDVIGDAAVDAVAGMNAALATDVARLERTAADQAHQILELQLRLSELTLPASPTPPISSQDVTQPILPRTASVQSADDVKIPGSLGRPPFPPQTAGRPTCSAWLRRNGREYPRTCQECGSGPCKHGLR